jgi:hypothetical protein
VCPLGTLESEKQKPNRSSPGALGKLQALSGSIPRSSRFIDIPGKCVIVGMLNGREVKELPEINEGDLSSKTKKVK